MDTFDKVWTCLIRIFFLIAISFSFYYYLIYREYDFSSFDLGDLLSLACDFVNLVIKQVIHLTNQAIQEITNYIKDA